jgi:hypothetical protein
VCVFYLLYWYKIINAECSSTLEGPVQFYTRFYNFKFAYQFEALWYHPQVAAAGMLY